MHAFFIFFSLPPQNSAHFPSKRPTTSAPFKVAKMLPCTCLFLMVNHAYSQLFIAMKVIITGATGMVGEGVLHQCLQHAAIDGVLVINRKPCGVAHRKLKEIIHSDFLDLSPIESQLTGYEACFFCLGVSSVGMAQEDYFKFTYTLTLHVATTLVRHNPQMIFCYVSGASTDSSEQGRMAWARIKGKTENDLMKLSFRDVYAFRPGFIRPIKGMRHTQPLYKYVNWLFPIGKAIAPNSFCTLEELALAMIHTGMAGYEKKVLEVRDILEAAKAG